MLNNKKESKIIGYLFIVNPIQDGHFPGCSRMLTAFCTPVLESLKIFFDKSGYNFDDASKIGYPRPS